MGRIRKTSVYYRRNVLSKADIRNPLRYLLMNAVASRYLRSKKDPPVNLADLF